MADDCIHHAGWSNGNGYGRVWYQGQHWLAHRLEWHLQVGPIPEGMYVLHKCDNPSCIAIEHLYVGDQKDNMRDRAERGRVPPRPEFCPQGHPATPENTYYPPSRPYPRCLTCHRTQAREWARRHRSKTRTPDLEETETDG
jgi:hypothetical protein